MPISANVPGIFGDISHDLYACDFFTSSFLPTFFFFLPPSSRIRIAGRCCVLSSDQCFDAVFSPMKLIIVFDNRFVVFYSGFFFRSIRRFLAGCDRYRVTWISLAIFVVVIFCDFRWRIVFWSHFFNYFCLALLWMRSHQIRFNWRENSIPQINCVSTERIQLKTHPVSGNHSCPQCPTEQAHN